MSAATKAGDLLSRSDAIAAVKLIWGEYRTKDMERYRIGALSALDDVLHALETGHWRGEKILATPPAEPALPLPAPVDAIGLLRRCSSWLALMNSGKEGDGHVFDKLRRDLHAFLFQRPNPTPSASDTEPASAAEGALPAKALVLVTRNQLLNALAFMASEDDEIAIAETEDGLIAYSVDHPEETIDLFDEAPEPAQRASSGDAMALSASELDDFTRRLIERQVPFPPDIAMLIREHWDELFDDKPVAQSADTPSEAMDWRRIANLLGEHVKKHSATYDCERCRLLIAKYDDAFALASRPQPARGDCSTSMLALLREIRDELVGDVDYCSGTGGNKAARLVAAIDMEIHRATGEITA